MGDDKIKKRALECAKRRRKAITEKWASAREYPAVVQPPVSVFMGGSPGAGKTEVALRLARNLEDLHEAKFVRIDADELRKEFSEYCGANAHLFQQAATLLVHEIHSAALKREQSFIMDGTFSNCAMQFENVRRSLKRGRRIAVLFVHQSPAAAWRFVRSRERIEGRGVPAEAFVRKYLDSRRVANAVKREFGGAVLLNLVVKNDDGSDKFRRANIDSVDNYVRNEYNADMLREMIGSEL